MSFLPPAARKEVDALDNRHVVIGGSQGDSSVGIYLLDFDLYDMYGAP